MSNSLFFTEWELFQIIRIIFATGVISLSTGVLAFSFTRKIHFHQWSKSYLGAYKVCVIVLGIIFGVLVTWSLGFLDTPSSIPIALLFIVLASFLYYVGTWYWILAHDKQYWSSETNQLVLKRREKRLNKYKKIVKEKLAKEGKETNEITVQMQAEEMSIHRGWLLHRLFLAFIILVLWFLCTILLLSLIFGQYE